MSAEDRSRQKVAAVIPAYNEERRIGAVVKAVRAQNLDVLVVDDGSKDGTAAAAEAAGAQVLRHEGNQGKGVALNNAFRAARERGYEVVVTLDADGQHPPGEISRFVEAMSEPASPC